MTDDGGTDTAGGAEQEGPRRGARPSTRPGRRRVLTGQGALRRARAHVQELTGRSPETVIGLERDHDYGWHVTVETPEPAGNAHQAPLPAEHSVHLSAEGELISCRRADHRVRDSLVAALDKGFALDLGLGADIVADVDAELLGIDLLGLRVRGALTPPQRGTASGRPGEQKPGDPELGE